MLPQAKKINPTIIAMVDDASNLCGNALNNSSEMINATTKERGI